MDKEKYILSEEQAKKENIKRLEKKYGAIIESLDGTPMAYDFSKDGLGALVPAYNLI